MCPDRCVDPVLLAPGIVVVECGEFVHRAFDSGRGERGVARDSSGQFHGAVEGFARCGEMVDEAESLGSCGGQWGTGEQHFQGDFCGGCAGVWPALHELLLAELRGQLDLDRCSVDASHVHALKGGTMSAPRRSTEATPARSTI